MTDTIIHKTQWGAVREFRDALDRTRYHAVYHTSRGVPKSNYFATEQEALAWLISHPKAGKLLPKGAR
jgi:hypothetical protein